MTNGASQLYHQDTKTETYLMSQTQGLVNSPFFEYTYFTGMRDLPFCKPIKGLPGSEAGASFPHVKRFVLELLAVML